jgi:hypothetical protein
MRWLKRTAAIVGVGLVAIQLVPYGRAHDNPPVVAEPAWDSAQTRDLAVRACFDCHSNEVSWPWYSNIAPMSWLVQRDVDEGREELNFSEWHRPQESDDAAETVLDRSMPPRQYLLLHPDARLTDDQLRALAAGLEVTAGDDDSEDDENDDEDEDDDDD